MRNHVLSVRESLVRRRGGGPMFGAAWMVLYAALSAACVLLPDPDPSRRDATIDDGARSDEGIDVEVGRDASDADVPSDDGDAPPDRECAAPWIRCGGECVDPRTSAAHCGGCSQACARANAASACVNGSCILGACLAGFGDCDGRPDNGCETDVRASAAHCGRCGVMCALPNAVAACRGGACGLGSCVGGYADCDGIADTGCEVDTRNRLDHCGGCRRACTADAGAMAVCRGGVCEATACSPPMLDCVAPGSCTTDVRSHLMHCGRCGNACGGANATPACDAGACDLSCAPGWGNCDGNDATGCETHLQSSGAHCGMCGRRCAADQNCMGGACVCPTGLTTCPGTSCVNLATDRSHCGSCGNACALPNTAANCVMGVCTVGICSANFADCNGSRMDGCEVNVQAEVSHCGGCGRPCAPPNATARCVGGVCTITGCAAGYADCDGMTGNGCEVDTRSSASHCGACGNACAPGINGGAAVACVAGTCGGARLFAGLQHACMIEPGAAVRCWGSNRSQQCGVTSATPITAPTAVAALASSTRLALGDVHGISLGATPRGWGLNDLGQIASQVVSNTTLYPPSPCCSSPLLSGLSAVASGWYHACGITGAGTVACWGYNVSGQLGNNTTTQATSGMSSAPVTVLTAAGPLTGAVELALGRYHSCARTASRRVYCWGSNNRGQLGRAASPAVPSFAAAVLDGASELQGVDEIAAGEEFSCARVGGTVRCWGDNLRGDTGAPSPSREVSAPNLLAPIADAVEIAAGQHFACAIRAEGRVHCWGYNMEGQAGVGASGSPVLASAANLLRADGVGGPVLTGAVQLALGGAFGCAALRSGALVCWGRNAEGQLGDGTTVTRFWTARAAWPR